MVPLNKYGDVQMASLFLFVKMKEEDKEVLINLFKGKEEKDNKLLLGSL